VLNIRGNARISFPGPLAKTTRYVLLEQEDWFEDEIRFVRRWLRPGMRAIDVGAAFGVYTVAMAQSVGEAGGVWAFEPTPGTAQFLERNLALNALRNVALVGAAVSDRRGEVAFAVHGDPELNEIALEGTASSATLTVPATTLDEAAREHRWADIDFLKLDVEGHEAQALRGGEELLRRGSPLVMFEINKSGALDLSALDPLAAIGYGFYRLLPGPLMLVPFDRQEPVDHFQLNIFACKPERARRLAAEGFLGDPAAAAESRPEAWADYARSMPYARELSPGWRSAPGFFAGAGDKAYFDGLAAFAASRRAGPGSERCASLERALERVGEAIADGDRPTRRLTYARLAWEVGLRALAAETLADGDRLLEEADGRFPEPFLPPGVRYDRVPTEGRPRDWLRCAVTEQYEKLHHLSSLWCDDTPARLAPILGLPFRSPEMDRRCQLVRMRLGQQARPEGGAMLSRQSEENLNPDFWCGS